MLTVCKENYRKPRNAEYQEIDFGPSLSKTDPGKPSDKQQSDKTMLLQYQLFQIPSSAVI